MTAGVTVWLGTAFLLPFTLVLVRDLAPAALTAIAPAVHPRLVAMALAHVTWAYVLSRVPAGQAATMLLAVPLVAVMIGWRWLGDEPNPLAVDSGMLALAGAFAATVGRWGRGVRQVATSE